MNRIERDPITNNTAAEDPRTGKEGPERECPIHGYYNGDECPECYPKQINKTHDTDERNS